MPHPAAQSEVSRHSYRGLLPYIRPQWRGLLAILALTLTMSVAAALQPLPLKLLADTALTGTPAPEWLRSLFRFFSIPTTSYALVLAAALASVLVFLVNSALDAALTLAWSKAGTAMVYDLANDLFARLQRLSVLFHYRQPVGDSISRLTSDTWSVYTLTSTLLMSPIQQVMTLASVGLVAWNLDRQLALLSLSTAPLLGASTFFFSERMKRRARRTREAQSRLTSFVQRTLTSIPLVQTFSAEDRNRRNFLTLAGDVVKETRGAAIQTSGYGMVNGLITTLGTVIVLYVGASRAMAGTLPVGTLLVFTAYMTTLQKAAESLLKIYASLKPVEASIDRVMEVLHSTEAIIEKPTALPVPDVPRGERGRIQFEAVSFGYEPERPVLRNISFEARPGETIALVGHSGAGKSTLVGLIPRFFDPQQGRVLLDGVDLRDLKVASLRSQVALVLQEPYLLPLSIAENIAYGRPGATREQIIAAAVAANAHEFIQDLPDGYDTIIGERGSTLSGGQKQRLSIARALLKDAQVLILDEPTSALDPRTEALLMDALHRLMRDRTTFVIAHRLSTVRNATRILVLDQGEIVESGSHEELLARNGAYARFYRLQEVA